MQVIAIVRDEELDDESPTKREPIVESTELVSATSTGIEIDMIFVNPVNVSQGYEPDMVLLALDLSELETVQGERLPSTIYNYRQIPTQMLNETEAVRV